MPIGRGVICHNLASYIAIGQHGRLSPARLPLSGVPEQKGKLDKLSKLGLILAYMFQYTPLSYRVLTMGLKNTMFPKRTIILSLQTQRKLFCQLVRLFAFYV